MASAISVALKLVDNFSGTLTGLNQGWELVSKSIGLAASAGKLAMSGLGQLGAVIGNFAEVGNQFEQLGVRMETVFGGSGPAQEALDWATEFSTKTPYAISEISESMISLQNAGIDPMSGALEAVGNTAAATGRKMSEILEPLNKIALTGKVDAEVINSLNAKGINATEALRDAYNLTAEEAKNIGSLGLDATEVIDILVEKMGDYDGAMGALSNTAEGAWSTINDLFTGAKKLLLDSGAWDYYVSQVIRIREVLTQVFDNPQIKEAIGFIGEGVADTMKYAVGIVEDAAPSIIEGAFGIVKGIANAVNATLDLLSNTGILTIIEFSMTTLIQTVSVAVSGISQLIGGLVGTAIEGFGQIIGLIRDYAQDNPLAATKFGLDLEELAVMETSWTKAGLTVKKYGKDFGDEVLEIGKSAIKLNADVSQKLKVSRIDVSAIEAFEKEAKGVIDTIDFSTKVTPAILAAQKKQAAIVKDAAEVNKQVFKLKENQEKAAKEKLKLDKKVAKAQLDAIKTKLADDKALLKEQRDKFREKYKDEKEALKEKQDKEKEIRDIERDNLKERKEKFDDGIQAEKDVLEERAAKFKAVEDGDKEYLKMRIDAHREIFEQEKDDLKERRDANRKLFDDEQDVLDDKRDANKETYDLAKGVLNDEKDKKSDLNKDQIEAARDAADADKELRNKLEKIARDNAEKDVAKFDINIEGLEEALKGVRDSDLSSASKATQTDELKAKIEEIKKAEAARKEALKKELAGIKESSDAEQLKNKKAIEAINDQAAAEAKAFKAKIRKLDDDKKLADAELKAQQDLLDEKVKKEKEAQEEIAKALALRIKEEKAIQKTQADFTAKLRKDENDAVDKIKDSIDAKIKAEAASVRDIEKDIKTRTDAEDKASKAVLKDIATRQKEEEKGNKIAIKAIDDKTKAEKKAYDASIKNLEKLAEAAKGKGADASKDAVRTAKSMERVEKSNQENNKVLKDISNKVGKPIVDIREKDKEAEQSNIDQNSILQALVKIIQDALVGAAQGEPTPFTYA